MDVRLLVVENCPNEGPAMAVLRQALTDLGLAEVSVRTEMVTTQQQAEQLGFVGSPTILIDGTDPFAAAGRTPALACRVYQRDTGPAGVPDRHTLRQALRQAAETGATGEAAGGPPG